MKQLVAGAVLLFLAPQSFADTDSTDAPSMFSVGAGIQYSGIVGVRANFTSDRNNFYVGAGYFAVGAGYEYAITDKYSLGVSVATLPTILNIAAINFSYH